MRLIAQSHNRLLAGPIGVQSVESAIINRWNRLIGRLLDNRGTSLISKLRSNNQCYNTAILTQVKGQLDGSGGFYLKVAGSRKQEQRPGKQTALQSRKQARARAKQSILVI